METHANELAARYIAFDLVECLKLAEIQKVFKGILIISKVFHGKDHLF